MLALTKKNAQNRSARETRARREKKKVKRMEKRKRRVNNHKSRKRKNNLVLMVKGCEVEVEAVEDLEAVEEEDQEVGKTMKNHILAVKDMKRRAERIHLLTRNLVMGLRTKSMEAEMQDLLDQRLEINFRMEKDQEITRLQDSMEKKESSRKEDHIVVEVAVEVVKVVEEVAKVVEEVMMVVEVEAVKEVAEVVEEVEVEEAAEVAEMAPHPPTKLTRRSRRRIDSSETVKSLTMSNSLKSPPELHRCVLSQGRPN